MPLPTIWFVLVGVLIAGYAVLDGFDLGVGILHLFVKGDDERRLSINSIGPVWDGNEVWLVTAGGGALRGVPRGGTPARSRASTPPSCCCCSR